MTNILSEMPDQEILRLVEALRSLQDGDRAAEKLAACGKRAIPHLANFLLNTPPRTISLPRCRAVRALGELGAYSPLIAYFKNYERPQDSAVMFAEDAVRSEAARMLAECPSAEVFHVLLDAAWQRVTGGLVLALSEFHRPESVPLLFEILEDDLCRTDAMNSLRKAPDAVRQFGLLSIRGLTGVTLEGPSAICRRRATLQLLSEVGVFRSDWPDLRRFLFVNDPAAVIAAARTGLAVANEDEWPEIVLTLFKVAPHFDSFQEGEVEELMDSYSDLTRKIALEIVNQKQHSGGGPNWMSPYWRLLNHASGRALENRQARAS